MKRFTLVFALAAFSLLIGCRPSEQSASQEPPAQEVPAQELPSPAVEGKATAALPVASATPSPTTTPEATKTFIPVVEAQETASPTDVPTATPMPATPVDSITLAPVIASGLQSPTFVTHAKDQRLFIVERAGTVRIFDGNQLLPQPFIDLRDRVGSGSSEQGLLSIAFHPDFGEAGQPGENVFYVYYTDLGGDTVVSQFNLAGSSPNQADPDSEIQVLTLEQPGRNHNGGLITFGPDGYLYIGLGDGGGSGDTYGNGQNLSTLLGAILRIAVDPVAGEYAIPTDNPFADSLNARPEIWAWGLRNPWRFSFDRLTGDQWIADVGQGAWEEVSFVPAGSGGHNLGWNIMEGTHCFRADECDMDGLTLPVFEYDHSQGCSTTGGFVYRGQDYPELYGNYFLSDYCEGTFWRLFPGENGQWLAGMVLESPLTVSSFGEDVNGELYVLDYRLGGLYRIQP